MLLRHLNYHHSLWFADIWHLSPNQCQKHLLPKMASLLFTLHSTCKKKNSIFELQANLNSTHRFLYKVCGECGKSGINNKRHEEHESRKTGHCNHRQRERRVELQLGLEITRCQDSPIWQTIYILYILSLFCILSKKNSKPGGFSSAPPSFLTSEHSAPGWIFFEIVAQSIIIQKLSEFKAFITWTMARMSSLVSGLFWMEEMFY